MRNVLVRNRPEQNLPDEDPSELVVNSGPVHNLS